MNVYQILQNYVEDPNTLTKEEVEQAFQYMRSLQPSKANNNLIGALMSIAADAGENVPTLLDMYDIEVAL